MNTHQTWRKSSRSSPQNACVELAVGTTQTGIRDTKNRNGGTLTVRAASLRAFLASIKTGQLNRQDQAELVNETQTKT